MAVANSTNMTPSPGTVVVDPVAGKGDYTTIAAAIAAVSSGSTIYVRPGTYTENPVIDKNLTISGIGSGQFTSQTIILGKITVSVGLFPNIRNLTLQTNSDYCVSVTVVSYISLKDCYILANNNAALQVTGGGQIYCTGCDSNNGAAGIAFFSVAASSFLQFKNCNLINGNASTTISDCAGTLTIDNSRIEYPVSTSGSGTISAFNSDFNCTTNSQIPLTFNAASFSEVYNCVIKSVGNNECITIAAGASLQLFSCSMRAVTPANAITGAGTLYYGGVSFNGLSGATTISTSSITAYPWSVQQGGTGLTSTTANQLLYSSATNTIAGLATANTAVLATNGSGVPSLTTTPACTSITLSGGTALANYVEGTWTPAITFGGAATGVTYTQQIGKYTRIGNKVFISCSLILSAAGSSTGAVVITGLPVTVLAGENQFSIPINGYQGFTFAAGYDSLYGIALDSTTTMALYRSGTGVALAAVNNTVDTVAATFQIIFTGFYQV